MFEISSTDVCLCPTAPTQIASSDWCEPVPGGSLWTEALVECARHPSPQASLTVVGDNFGPDGLQVRLPGARGDLNVGLHVCP